jgi:hypothetical protein
MAGSLKITTFVGSDGVTYKGLSPWRSGIEQQFFGVGPEAYWVDNKGWVKVASNVEPLTPKEPPSAPILVDGPRLGDLSVTSSAYGNPRPIGFGTIRMKSQLIWSRGLDEQKVKSVSLGQGEQKEERTITTNYLYSASFAVAFGQGPCSDVLRIWANGVLVFDKTDVDQVATKAGLIFRIHKGTSTQGRDPLILEKEEIDYTPAFRDTVYLVFENMQLADFQDTIPTIEAEISYDTTPTRPQQISGSLISSQLNSFDSQAIAIDWDRGYAYYQSVSPTVMGLNGLSRVNMNSNLKDREVLAVDSLNQGSNQGQSRFSSLGNIGIMPDGAIIASINIENPISTNNAPLVRLDPTSLRETGRFGSGGTSTTMSETNFAFGNIITGMSALTKSGRSDYVLIGGHFNSVGVLSVPAMEYVWDSDTALSSGLEGSSLLSIVAGENGEAWILTGSTFSSSSAETVNLYKFKVTPSGTPSISLHRTFSVSELMGGEATLDIVGPMSFDSTDPGVVIWVGGSSGNQHMIKYNMNIDEIVWTTENIDVSPQNHTWENSRLTDDTIGWINGTNGAMVDTLTGELLHNDTAPDWSVSESASGTGAYDSKTKSFVGLTTVAGKPFIRNYFDRGVGNGEGLDSIISQLCGFVGLEAADIDVTDLSSTIVPGFAILERTTARAAIETLTDTYLVDGFESDFKLKYKFRGSVSIRDLTEGDLGELDPKFGDVVQERRIQEVELPERYTLQYKDKTNDYGQSAHSVKRIVFPDQTMYSNNQKHVKLEIALHPDVAKQQAEKIMYGAWIARTEYSFRFPWTQLDLDPSDVITITLDNGTLYQTRITDFDIGADLVIESDAVSEQDTQYVSSTVEADGGIGRPVQSIAFSTFIKTFLIDSTLLIDDDEVPNRISNPLYLFMSGFDDNAFERGSLYRSDDNNTYSVVSSEVNAVTWGLLTSSLGDPKNGNPFITDDVNTITITMSVGGSNLITIPEAQMLANFNRAMIIKQNGEIELVNFRDVVDNGDGTYDLSYLLRGRRGTDTMAFDHTSGEVFLLLNDESVGETFTSPISDLDTLIDYKGVGSGQYFAQGDDIPLTSNLRALMPYALASLEIVEDGSSNIDFSWERRTRVGGDWLEGTGTVPLNEDTEAYEIDIYLHEGISAPLLRTITGITSEAYEYLNADVLTDFGSFPPQLSFEAYQISAQAERGFARRVTLGLPNITVDEYWNNVVLLSGFDGTDAATSAIDDSDSNHTFVFDNGVHLDTAQKKFGMSSVLMDGADDNLYVNDNEDFDFEADPFTIEGWFRWNTIQDSFNGLIAQWYSAIGAEQWLFDWDTTGTLQFSAKTGAGSHLITSGSWTPTIGVWYHLAVDRDSSDDFRIYVDGVVIGTGNDTGTITSTGSPQMSIGHYQGNRELDGWVDEVRITKGVARYGGAFTAPTNRFPRQA